ncbi:tRNA nucleotidyltransferase (CCA-adding enzyme) [Plasmodium inui San Antonio 1]|uniref:tRNA nucleotidyltransferase (CCA-adding enzyme) n=1 Tax=Plasmodium inui San Antonio 1 TaxID=1237626 RepID=W6ZX98_9APIC|nr:tRNA nucleotidyltransferase (CCA-adding enzyme) [Plasmodium inui San Antonio 1]EUD65437.1 tRNA nucleotidyltransferase (CCA-adding enzyme) [Plasmodium inui San Antonio 1]
MNLLGKKKIFNCTRGFLFLNANRRSHHLGGRSNNRKRFSLRSCSRRFSLRRYSTRGEMEEEAYVSYLNKYVVDERELAQAVGGMPNGKGGGTPNGKGGGTPNGQQSEVPKGPKGEVSSDQSASPHPEGTLQIEELIKKTMRKEEEELFSFLQKVNEAYNLQCTLRVVGGWVRDKFLGISNDDIDLTVDNMKGSDFCNYIKKYIQEKEKKNFNFGIIKINSDQSKHLETSSFHLFNFQVDIVNLRNEKYTEESRIPEIVIGTPEEDALRRDFTVNALFYNLSNNRVEDYTRRGILHLKNKVICTPLDPLSTFLDDPLRIIRCIRFCGFFNFFVEKSVFDVLKNEHIMKSFKKKISRSRLSSEMMKIFSKRCENIVLSLTLLNYSSYAKEIFSLPGEYFVQNGEVLETDRRKGDRVNKKGNLLQGDLLSGDANEATNSEAANNAATNNAATNNAATNNAANGAGPPNGGLDSTGVQNGNVRSANGGIHHEEGHAEGTFVNASPRGDNKMGSITSTLETGAYSQPGEFSPLQTSGDEKTDWCVEGLQYVKFFKDIEKNNLLRETFPGMNYHENVNNVQLCLYLLPLKNHHVQIKKGGKSEPVVSFIIRESLKFPLKHGKFCVQIYEGFSSLYKLYKNIDVFNFLKNSTCDGKKNAHIIGDVVLFLKSVGEKWDLLLLIFFIFHKYKEVNKMFVTTITADVYLSDFAKKLYQFILENKLQAAYNVKPFLKWPDIRHNFPQLSPNRIGEVYEQIIRFSCIHGEDEAKCIEFLKNHFKK